MTSRGTVVFDVDEVLAERVYDGTPRPDASTSYDKGEYVYYVRNGVREFVRDLAKYADLAVYTANKLSVVQEVIDYVFSGLDVSFVLDETSYDGHKLLPPGAMVIIDDTLEDVNRNGRNQYIHHTDIDANRPFASTYHDTITLYLNSQQSEQDLEFFTDGSSLNNQLDQSKRFGGAGIYASNVPWLSGPLEHYRGYIPDQRLVTNNTMELLAALIVLRSVSSRNLIPGNLHIYSDSIYVIGGHKKPNGHKSNNDLWSEYVKHRNRLQKIGWIINLKKVKGHSGVIDGNHHADRLACLGSAEARHRQVAP
jgi:ribonuclease HI